MNKVAIRVYEVGLNEGLFIGDGNAPASTYERIGRYTRFNLPEYSGASFNSMILDSQYISGFKEWVCTNQEGATSD